MSTTIQHFSDTIQQNPYHISQHDTTVDRLRFYYESLAREIGINYDSISFTGSEYGNSFQTAAQTMHYLQCLENPQTQVVLVNNAARSKHSNSGEAKGSYPLWCEIEIQGVTHHIVGVDDDAFEFISYFQKAGTSLKQVRSIEYGNFRIQDTSKGSQFRSKDYFPLIQLIFLKELQEKGEITEEYITPFFELIPYEITRDIDDFRRRLLEQIGEISENLPEIKEVIQTFLSQIQKTLETEEDTGSYLKKYVSPEFQGIEHIQIIGEFWRIQQDLGIQTLHSDFAHTFIEEHKDILQLYTNTRNALADNELLLIDRDKFGNCIFASSSGVNSLDELLQLDYQLDEELLVEYPGGTFHATLTKTISDKTGKNCIWQSSSTGPYAERFLNINTSFSAENNSPIEDLQTLPIGSILRFKGKSTT